MLRTVLVLGSLLASIATGQAEAVGDDAPVWADKTSRLRPLDAMPPASPSPEALAPIAAPPPARAHRGPAPSEPMSEARARREWDGTGELLLIPGFPPRPFTGFIVGASFQGVGENGGADRDERSGDRSCMEGTYSLILDRGMIGGSTGSDHSRYAPRMISARRDGNAEGLTFTRSDCRLTMRLRAMVPKDGGWIETHEVDPNPFGVPLSGSGGGGGPFLRPTESFVLPTRPEPAEFSRNVHTWGIGRLLPRPLASACPMHFGTMMFVPDGIRFTMPWIAQPPITPGLRRDAAARVTTVIFQTPGCRLELAIDRETRGADGLWTRSPLSPIGSPETRD